MSSEKFRPLVDKLFGIIFIPTVILLISVTVAVFLFPEPIGIIIIVAVDIVTVYFLISPLFGYVELKKNSVYIKYGLILKKEIPYSKIRKIEKERKFYSNSMISLKNSFDHVNIKYNTFDVTSVSVIDNDTLITAIKGKIRQN